MWHEARKQERKIRGMLVDYRKRAERRQDFYERIVSVVSTTVFFWDVLEVMISVLFLRVSNIESRSDAIHANPWAQV